MNNFFQWYNDDVIICTMPKSGTTWTQEIAWTLMNNLNLDNSDAKIPLKCFLLFSETTRNTLEKWRIDQI